MLSLDSMCQFRPHHDFQTLSDIACLENNAHSHSHQILVDIDLFLDLVCTCLALG